MFILFSVKLSNKHNANFRVCIKILVPYQSNNTSDNDKIKDNLEVIFEEDKDN